MTELSAIPATPHWAILQTVSVTIPGNERSRTHPGHGYPATTETYITYRAFTSQAEWEREIERLASSRWNNFRAIKVEPARVGVKVTVE